MALDFSNQDLRGKSFKNQDLSGANFSNAECGLHWWIKIGILLINVILGFVAGLLASICATFLCVLANSGKDLTQLSNHFWWFFWMMNLIILVGGIFSIQRNQVINLIWIIAGAVVGTVAVAGAGVGTGKGTIVVAITKAVEGAGAIVVTGAIAGAGAITGVGVVAIAGAVMTVAVIGTVEGMIATIVAGAIAIAGAVAVAGPGAGAVMLGSAVILILATYIGWRTRCEDSQFAIFRQLGLKINSLGGVSFKNVLLNKATFHQANLKNSNFYQVVTMKTNWRDCKNLKLAYLKGTILEIPIVRDLLVSGNAQHQSFVGLNLTGAYLKDANLENANFSDANLTNADLRNANLCGAKLSRATLLQADLSGANLTGAYLDNWNIDDSTILDKAEADYVYLPERQQVILKMVNFIHYFNRLLKH